MKTTLVSRAALGTFLLSASLLPSFAQEQEIEADTHVNILVDHTATLDEPGPVTFLGVETARVSATLAHQLGLPTGMGLVVQRVVKESAASEVLEKHDILTKFDDQLLVSSEQLGVLVRSKQPGDSVVLTLVRAGQQETKEIELREKQSARAEAFFEFKRDGADHGSSLFQRRTEGLENHLHPLGDPMPPEDVDHLMSRLHDEVEQRAELEWVHEGNGPVVRMLNTKAGNVLFSDEVGSVQLKADGAGRVLIVKSPSGDVLFEGPVDSEEQRRGLEETVRARLEKVEGIDAIKIQTDEDFELDRVRVLRPGAKSVNLWSPHGEMGNRMVSVAQSQ